MGRKKDFDENALLEKAVNLFWKKGYSATSAQDLVDELEINRSSLYNTYSDKKTLFKKSLLRYQEKQTDSLISTLNKAEDPQRTIHKLFKDIIKESLDDNSLKGCFMVNTAVELAGQDKEIGELVNRNNESVEDALTAMIEKGQKKGQFSTKKSARAFARFINGNITALRVTARSGADKSTLHDIADVALCSLI